MTVLKGVSEREDGLLACPHVLCHEQLNLPFHSFVYFDPFSCYVPLRVEAFVDIVLGDLLGQIPEQPKVAGSETPGEALKSLLNDTPKKVSSIGTSMPSE